MTIKEKRKYLRTCCDQVMEEDLDLAIRIMREFAAAGLNRKHQAGQKKLSS